MSPFVRLIDTLKISDSIALRLGYVLDLKLNTTFVRLMPWCSLMFESPQAVWFQSPTDMPAR